MTQQWGGAPDQWTRGQPTFGATFGQAPAWPQQTAQWPAPSAPAQQWPAPTGQGYPYQGYQQPGSFPPPPPRRRRSFLGSLVRIAFAVIFVMVAISVIRGVLTGILDSTTGGSTGSGQTSGSGTSGGSSSGGSGTNSGTDGSGSGTTQYQNEGYQAPPADLNPPDLPQPTTYSEAQSWLTKNAIYSQSVPSPTSCTMTPIQNGLSKSQLEARLNEQMACLMAVWQPPMEAAGFELPRPPVTVYSSAVTTACGVMKEVNAAYCAGDQRVYYALPLLDALPSQVSDTKYAVEAVIAHEFGHAIQARTGILISDRALESKASKADATVMSRRTEQQADCFGGLYVESVAQSQGLTQANLQSLVNMTYYLGDDVLSGNPNINGDHGQGKNRQAWFAKGVQTSQISVCNTWVAPASSVR